MSSERLNPNGKPMEEVVVTSKRIIKSGDRQRIDKLKYNFDQGARPNRYRVDMYCPKLGINFEGIRCLEAQLPGRQIEPYTFSEYGTPRNQPIMLDHDGQQVSFTFVCDSTFADRFLIEAWQGVIFGGEGGNSALPQMNYYYDYVGEVHITQMTNSDKDSLKYVLHEAYPISFIPQQLSYERTDEILRFECTFAFRTFETFYENPTSISGLNRGARAIGAFNDIIGLFGNKSKTLTKFQDRLNKLSGLFG